MYVECRSLRKNIRRDSRPVHASVPCSFLPAHRERAQKSEQPTDHTHGMARIVLLTWIVISALVFLALLACCACWECCVSPRAKYRLKQRLKEKKRTTHQHTQLTQRQQKQSQSQQPALQVQEPPQPHEPALQVQEPPQPHEPAPQTQALSLSQLADVIVESHRSSGTTKTSHVIENHLNTAELDLEAVQATALGTATRAQVARVASYDEAQTPSPPAATGEEDVAREAPPPRVPYKLQPDRFVLNWVTNWESAVCVWCVLLLLSMASLIAACVVFSRSFTSDS